MEYEKEFKNQILTNGYEINKIGNMYNLSKATIKIFMKDGVASGFFIKLERNKKPFYCLMTNQHVITPEMILNKEHITILYDNEKKINEIELNPKERIILCFLENLKIDITIVEIIPKDEINDPSYFLSPYINSNYENFNPYKFVKKNIEIIQYPKGGELSYSKGMILGIYPENDNIFIHNSKTKDGSSGSPIVLSGEQTVFAIHKGVYIEIEENAGIFIEGVVKFLKNFKKNGLGIEYYENGKIKYKGNFLDDEYNGEGTFYYPNGDYYVGQFIRGKKNGYGYIMRNNIKIKEGYFINDEFIDNNNDNYFSNGINNYNYNQKNMNNVFNNNYNNNMNNLDNYNFMNNNLYNNNFMNNNMNYNNCIDNIFCDTLFGKMGDQAVETLHSLGIAFGGKCKVCKHSVKDHNIFMKGIWCCEKCPINSNLCKSL